MVSSYNYTNPLNLAHLPIIINLYIINIIYIALVLADTSRHKYQGSSVWARLTSGNKTGKAMLLWKTAEKFPSLYIYIYNFPYYCTSCGSKADVQNISAEFFVTSCCQQQLSQHFVSRKPRRCGSLGMISLCRKLALKKKRFMCMSISCNTLMKAKENSWWKNWLLTPVRAVREWKCNS